MYPGCHEQDETARTSGFPSIMSAMLTGLKFSSMLLNKGASVIDVV
jgi:hypothetical protein